MAVYRSGNFEYQFNTEGDIVNGEDMIPFGEFNPHNVRPFILHDAGFVIGIVFAESLQDALDAAVDKDKLDMFQVKDSELEEIMDAFTEGYKVCAGGHK